MAASLAHQMAMVNSHIASDVVESSEFPHLVQRYNVMGVPKIVINDKASFEGALPEDAFVKQIQRALQAS